MIRNVSIKINGVETGDDTQLAVNKINKDCLLTEYDRYDNLNDMDLKDDKDNEYDIFIDIIRTDDLDIEAKLYKEKFENLRAEYIRLQKFCVDMIGIEKLSKHVKELCKALDEFKIE